MSTEAPAAPSSQSPAAEVAQPLPAQNHDAESLDIFTSAQKNAQPPEPEPQPTPQKTEKPPKEAAPDKPTTPQPDEIPDELLTGKPAEPKEKTDDDEFGDLPASASEKSKTGWKALKEAKHVLSVENAELKKAVAQLKQSTHVDTKFAEELESHKKRVTELEAIVERKAFEESPRFKQYGVKEGQITEAAKKHFKGSELKPELFDVVARLEPQDRMTFLEERGADVKLLTALAPHFANLDVLHAEKDATLANHKEHYKDWETQERAQAEARQKAEMEQELSEFQKFGEELLPNLVAFKRFNGADKWNSGVDTGKELAQKVFKGEASNGEIAEVIWRGVRAKALEDLYVKVVEKNKSLQEQLGKLTAASPNMGSGQPIPFTPSNDASQPWEQSALQNFERARLAQGG